MKTGSQKRPSYVLIMEDNPSHAELLTEVLDRHFSPIIIHTVDTIKAIRRRFKDIPLIVVTGRGDESLAAQLIRRGVTEYLVKTRETLESLPHVLEKFLKKT
jgi:FixJ family two-component response regulator